MHLVGFSLPKYASIPSMHAIRALVRRSDSLLAESLSDSNSYSALRPRSLRRPCWTAFIEASAVRLNLMAHKTAAQAHRYEVVLICELNLPFSSPSAHHARSTCFRKSALASGSCLGLCEKRRSAPGIANEIMRNSFVRKSTAGSAAGAQ